MKVSGVGPTGLTSTRRTDKTAGNSKGEFGKHLLDAISTGEEPHAVEPGVPVSGVESLLAIQEVPDALQHEGRRRARQRLVKRGADILERLDALRHGLLTGQISKNQIIELAQLVRGKRDEVDDPQLAHLLDEIELRAEVEIAKLTRA
jgi:hypothetical protein